MAVTIVAVEDAGFYQDAYTSGSTVKVTLRRIENGAIEYASCDGILIWDEEMACDEVFEEWVSYAEDGEEGYTYEMVEG